MPDDPVLVGTVVKAHGVRGEVVVLSESDNESRFRPGSVVHRRAGHSLVVRSAKASDRGILVGFGGIDDRAQAEGLIGAELFVPASARRSLDRNEFWPDQLIGLEARDGDGVVLGRVTEVDDTTPQARLVISSDLLDFEVPFVDELVPDVIIEAGYLVIRPVPGLID